jgi:hypothetical protein
MAGDLASAYFAQSWPNAGSAIMSAIVISECFTLVR